MSSSITDFTKGNIVKQLFVFSWPFLLSTLFQALYSVIDMLIAGWYMGKEGLAAITNGSQFFILTTNLIIGMAVGGTVLIAQYLGAKRKDELTSTIGTMFTLNVAFAALITTILLAFSGLFLNIMNTPPEVFNDAKSYLDVCAIGVIFIVGYNVVCAILRGMGDSIRPMYFVIVATIINVILDFVFVGSLGMRTAGAAYATIIAQGISFILSIIYLFHTDFVFEFKLPNFKVHMDKLKLLLKIGWPSSAQYFVLGMSFMVIVAVANSLGVATSAAVGSAAKVNAIAILPCLAMGSSIASMAGQNIGARLYDRAFQTMKIGMLISLSLSSILFILVQLFPVAVISLFSTDPSVIAEGVPYLRVISFDYILASIVICLNGLPTAAGETMYTLINTCINSIFLRAPLAIILAPILGAQGIALSVPIATVGSILISVVYVRRGSWKRPKVHCKPLENACI